MYLKPQAMFGEKTKMLFERTGALALAVLMSSAFACRWLKPLGGNFCPRDTGRSPCWLCWHIGKVPNKQTFIVVKRTWRQSHHCVAEVKSAQLELEMSLCVKPTEGETFSSNPFFSFNRIGRAAKKTNKKNIDQKRKWEYVSGRWKYRPLK